MKTLVPALISIGCLVLIGCKDDDTVTPSRKQRITAMSNGDIHYRILQYSDDGRVATVINGVIDESQDSVETVYHVAYDDDLIGQISSEDASHVYHYQYEDRRITESREYVDNALVILNEFYYDANGRVDLWVSRRGAGEEVFPLDRKTFQYDVNGNVVATELEMFDPVTQGHVLISTVTFLNFDDKRNSSSLFMNFNHPYHIPFKNNARIWRVKNDTGAVGETHYEYEYNQDGYVTRQRDINGTTETRFHFTEY